MSTGKKIALGLLIFLVLLVIGLAIAIPLLIDIDRYRPQVIAHLREETGKPAEIGRLTLTLFPRLSIRVDDFALGNPEGFPKGYFVKAKRVYAEVEARALWDRKVVITSLELSEPVINLLADARGRWNFESPAKPKAVEKPAAREPAAFSLGVISKVTVTEGQLTAANMLPSGRQGPTYFEARSVASELEQVDLNAFIESALGSLPRPVAPGWSRALAQNAGLKAGATWVASLFGATVAYAADPQPAPAAQGRLTAQSLRFGQLQVTSVRTRLRLFPKQVHFDALDFDLYGGHASGNLAFNFAGRNPRYNVQARMSGVNVARLLEAFPEARGKMTGTMQGNIKLAGVVLNSPDPLAGMRGTGQMSIRDGQLPSLQLNKNLMLLARLTQLGPAEGDPSSFSSIAADLNIAEQRIASEKATIVGSGVDVDGRGSVSLAGKGNLAYEGLAKVAAGQNPVTNILAGFSGATFADGKLTFPFTLTGTLESPQFKVKSATGPQALTGLQQILGGQQGQQTATQEGQTQQQPSPEDLVQGITGLFKKKQPAQQPSAPPQQ